MSALVCEQLSKYDVLPTFLLLIRRYHMILFTTYQCIMCILFIYTNPSPNKNCMRLIVATNRDEFYGRPSAPAFRCPDTHVIGGRDMEVGREGGMWFGVSLKPIAKHRVRCACLLNLTGETHVDGARGRGDIVLNYIGNDVVAADYAARLGEVSYNAYNFVTIEMSNDEVVTCHQSNVPRTCTKYPSKESVLAFGNSTLDVPLQKVLRGREMFKKIVSEHHDDDKETLVKKLVDLLRHNERFLPDAELKRRNSMYECLSSIFVQRCENEYGTRTHTIVLIDESWKLDFIEITMDQQHKWTTRRFNAQL